MDLGQNYTLSNGAKITVPQMIGSRTEIKDLGNNKYAVIITGSSYGAQPETKIYTADELAKEYPAEFERSPEKDVFLKASNPAETDKKSFNNIKNNSEVGSSINGSFAGVDYSLETNDKVIKNNAIYTGNINGKNTEINMQKPKKLFSRDLQITGKIGDNEFELCATTDLLGRTTIKGTYKGQEINVTLKHSLLGGKKCIKSEDKEIELKNNSFKKDNSINGDFAYDSELLPVILAYSAYEDDKNALMASIMAVETINMQNQQMQNQQMMNQQMMNQQMFNTMM